MAEDFRGEYYQKVDGKARVSIPAAFRRVLEAGDSPSPEFPRTRIVMVYGDKRRQFAEGYSQTGAERLSKMVRKLPFGSKARLRAERDLLISSLTIEIDEDGRIVLPQKVRDKIGFTEGEIVLAGSLDRFQIWRRDTYEAVFDALDDDDDILPEGADILSLLSDVDTEE